LLCTRITEVPTVKVAALMVIVLVTAGRDGCVEVGSNAGGDIPDAGPVDARPADVGPVDARPADAVRTCTQMACGYWGPGPGGQVNLGLEVPTSLAEIVDSAVMLCRNGVCVTGTLDTWTAGQVGWFSFAPSNEYVYAWINVPPGATPELWVGWGGHNALLTDPRDGDVYSAALLSAAGTLLAYGDGVATYHETYPNGPECDPVCYVASLSRPDAGYM
jgi:hypothetical protein